MTSPDLVGQAFQTAFDRRSQVEAASAALGKSRETLRLFADQGFLNDDQVKAVTLMFPIKGDKGRADWKAARELVYPPAPQNGASAKADEKPAEKTAK